MNIFLLQFWIEKWVNKELGKNQKHLNDDLPTITTCSVKTYTGNVDGFNICAHFKTETTDN